MTPIWTKLYIKEHASDLQKIIIKVYNSRREANAGEVELLLEEFKNPLCINRYCGEGIDLPHIILQDSNLY